MTTARRPDAPATTTAASNAAVWSLLLPPAERILCHAPGPTAWMLELARRGAQVDLVGAPAQAAGAIAPRLHAIAQPDGSAAYDLAVLWDPSTWADVRVWLAALRRLETAPRELAVWSRNPRRRDTALAWLRSDWCLWRSGWKLGTVHVALPEADRVRQLVEWQAWTRTPLLQHRRTHRAWKAFLQRSPWARWATPARLRRATSRGARPAASALRLVLAEVSLRTHGPVELERCLVSANGVVIASLRLKSAAGDQNAILKLPYVLGAEGRVARNAAGLEWLQSQRDALGTWAGMAPRLLARGRASHWNYTLEEHVPGSEAQNWSPRAASQAMHELCGALEKLAMLGQTARPLGPEAIDRHIGAPVRRSAVLLERELAQRLHAIGARLGEQLAGVPVPLVPRHGDFKLENVLGTPNTADSLRVLDWELWSPDGLPLLDLWHLLASRRGRDAGWPMGRVVREWLLPGAFSDAERSLIERLSAGLDPRYVEASRWLYWLDRLGPVAARGAWPLAGWERSNVVPVLEAGFEAAVPAAV